METRDENLKKIDERETLTDDELENVAGGVLEADPETIEILKQSATEFIKNWQNQPPQNTVYSYKYV